jgi:starvation-inducible outer membrane lipoprotein
MVSHGRSVAAAFPASKARRVLTDEATGQLYALRASGVDLSALVGQRVTVNGTLVPGYENGQVEGGPPQLDIIQVDPL